MGRGGAEASASTFSRPGCLVFGGLRPDVIANSGSHLRVGVSGGSLHLLGGVGALGPR